MASISLSGPGYFVPLTVLGWGGGHLCEGRIGKPSHDDVVTMF